MASPLVSLTCTFGSHGSEEMTRVRQSSCHFTAYPLSKVYQDFLLLFLCNDYLDHRFW